jgi:hypothetical protein
VGGIERVSWWLKTFILRYDVNGQPHEDRFNPGDPNGYGFFFVKNWNIGVRPLVSLPGKPGQGISTPNQKYFFDHVVVKRGDSVFDPSYGMQCPNSIIEWQTRSLDLILYRIPIEGRIVEYAYWGATLGQEELIERR